MHIVLLSFHALIFGRHPLILNGIGGHDFLMVYLYQNAAHLCVQMIDRRKHWKINYTSSLFIKNIQFIYLIILNIHWFSSSIIFD